MCNGEEIEKVDHFGYLGVHFESDGDPLATVKQRTAIAAKRFKELGMIWKREDIMTNIKTKHVKGSHDSHHRDSTSLL